MEDFKGICLALAIRFATVIQPDMQPDHNQGVWRAVDRKDRPKAFGVMHTRSRKSRWFATAAQRDAALSSLNGPFEADFEAVEAVFHFLRVTGLSVDDLPLLADLWRSHGGSTTLSAQEAAQRYLKAREGAVKVDTYRHIQKNLGRFSAAFSGVNLGEITPEAVQRWLDEDLGSFSAFTRKSHRKDVVALFNYWIKRGVVVRNPASMTATIRVDRDPVTVISPKEVDSLVASAIRDEPGAAGRFILESYCGVRVSTAAIFEWSWIHFEDFALEFPAWSTKGGRRKYRPGYPEKAFSLLRDLGEPSFSVFGNGYKKAKQRIFLRAGVSNPGNVLRHTFISAYYALTEDLHKTAQLALHRTPSTTDEHYAGRYSKKDAAALFTISCT